MTNDELMGEAHKNAQLYFSFIVCPDAPKPMGWLIYEECFIAGAKYAQQADSERVKELEKSLGDLTTAALAGVKPLPSQIETAFYLLKKLSAGREGDHMTDDELREKSAKAASDTCWSDDSARRVFQYGWESGYQAAQQADSERVKELEGALELLSKEAAGLMHAHEFALSADGGNSNMRCLEIRIEKAKKLLSADREGT